MQLQKWLVLSNCQAEGLAISLETLCSDIAADVSYVHEFDATKVELEQYDKIVVHHDHSDMLDGHIRDHDKVVLAPGLQFAAYHPDLGSFIDRSVSSTSLLKGPLVDYQSMLVVAAWMKGIGRRDALSLFTELNYRNAGYFGLWGSEKSRLANVFALCGLNLSDFLPRWVGRGPFMYTINHPKIECLSDLARAILIKTNMPIHDNNVLPYDNLSRGPVWPVYNELAEYYMVPGSYRFKPNFIFRSLSLPSYVDGLYDGLEGKDVDAIIPAATFAERFDRVLDAI